MHGIQKQKQENRQFPHVRNSSQLYRLEEGTTSEGTEKNL
jgi:hypothetical protein